MDKKRSLVASFALSLETPSAILSNYVTSRRFNLPADYWDKYPERLMAITKEQVQAAAAKYLDPARLQIVAVGDGAKIAEGLKQFGALEVYDPDGKRKAPSDPLKDQRPGRAGRAVAAGVFPLETWRCSRCAIIGIRAPVAQLDRAPDFESVGRRFESCRARQWDRD